MCRDADQGGHELWHGISAELLRDTLRAQNPKVDSFPRETSVMSPSSP